MCSIIVALISSAIFKSNSHSTGQQKNGVTITHQRTRKKTAKALSQYTRLVSRDKTLIPPLKIAGLVTTDNSTVDGKFAEKRYSSSSTTTTVYRRGGSFPGHPTSVLTSSRKQSSAASNCMGGPDGASSGASNSPAPSPSALLGPL